jgi:hypothetical protein
LLGLSFDPEEGSGMFLQNVGWLSADYAELYPMKTGLFKTTAVSPSNPAIFRIFPLSTPFS